MINTALSVRSLRVIAIVVSTALLLWSTGFPTFFQLVEAASVTSASDTLSNSDINAGSNHTIQFLTSNGILAGQTVLLTFPAGFILPSGLDFNDMDFKVNGVEKTLGSSPSGATWGVATTTTTIQFTTSGSNVASSSAIVILIGTNATSGATGDTQIINPTAGSYEIAVGGTMQDSGSFRVVILDNVTVSASVDTNFSFSVGGVGTGLTVNGTTTSTTSTATTIPFGTLTSGVISTLAQDLTVTTNAANGFAVTVYQDSNLLSSTGADIDGFIDGAYTNTPTGWVAPSGNPTNEKTWGHWGLTSNDPDLFGSNQWVSPSTTPRTVFSHTSVVSASTTRVGYQVQITPLQEAGNDYTTTLTYIATPTF